MWGGLKAFSRSHCCYSTPLEVKSFCICCLACACVKGFLLPALLSLWVGLGEYLKNFHWDSQCFGAWWVLLTGFSLLPSRLLAVLQFTQAPSPHPSIGHGFKTTKTNKEKEPYLSNVFQFGVSRCFLLCEQNTVPRKPLFVLIPQYKNYVKQVFVSAEHTLAIPNVFHKIA